ncbi:MAG: hypothetical protein GXZ11_05150 [Tissierellia bacterium]|nr:hypothetical protein [Tissierellia bacterium]
MINKGMAGQNRLKKALSFIIAVIITLHFNVDLALAIGDIGDTKPQDIISAINLFEGEQQIHNTEEPNLLNSEESRVEDFED